MRPRRHRSRHDTHGNAKPVAAADVQRLPPRVRPVLDCLLKGHSEKETARLLRLRPHTVHSYVKILYTRLGVRSRGELLALCLGGSRGAGRR